MKRYNPREYECGPHQTARGVMHEEEDGLWVSVEDTTEALRKMHEWCDTQRRKGEVVTLGVIQRQLNLFFS